MKLSIIIPVYNVENYLAKCLDSVVRPELSDYEIIAVDDGSTDSCPAILAGYKSRFPGIVNVISKENGGLGSARNAGLEQARGEYVLFLDSDDYLVDEAVAELLDKCNEKWDICFFDTISIDEAGKELQYLSAASIKGSFSLSKTPELLNSLPNAWNKLVKRSLFTEHSVLFPARVWYEDIRTMPKLYIHAERCCHVAKAYHRYLQRQGSIMNNSRAMRNLEIIDALDDLCDYYRAQGVFDRYKNELEYLAFYHMYIAASVRVCLADKNSPAAAKLRDAFMDRFPGYKANPYVQAAPAKYKLLDYLIYHRITGAVALIMGLNNKLK